MSILDIHLYVCTVYTYIHSMDICMYKPLRWNKISYLLHIFIYYVLH